MMEAGKGRNVPLDGIAPGADRDLGADRGWRRGGNRTREGSHRLAQGNPWAGWHGRSAQTSGGDCREGAPSRWTVVLHLGKIRGEKQVLR